MSMTAAYMLDNGVDRQVNQCRCYTEGTEATDIWEDRDIRVVDVDKGCN